MGGYQLGERLFLRNTLIGVMALLFLSLLSTQLGAAPSAKILSQWNQSDENNSSTINHGSWQVLLDRYLLVDSTDITRFDYGRVSAADKKSLQSYLSAMQELDPRRYRSDEQYAYWINTYNALTVQLIINDYPVVTIRQLGKGFFSFGPWDDNVVTVAGQVLTLNDIEHGILRPIWADDRIHFAVNCASISCPNLQPQAFTANNLDDLLDSAARQYLQHPRGVRFDKNRLVLSSLFKWYLDDFGINQDELLERLGDLLGDESGEKLADYQGQIKYRYDWRLNDVE